MQNIQERGDGIARRLPNIGLLNESIVEERDGALLLFVRTAPGVAAFCFLPRCRAGDVEPHLGELVPPCRCLPALAGRRSILAVRLAALAD